MSILSDEDKRWGCREIRVPVSPDDLGGPFVVAVASIESNTNNHGVACIERLPETVSWLQEYDRVYFHTMGDGETLQAIRLATADDRKKYRAPLWIQDPEVPECCGRPMFFIGQIDDANLCAEAPPGAKLWWHDAASFYVFTCAQCLSVKAVGQQY